MLFSADKAPKKALCAEQMENLVNTRPSRTKAKYGAVNGVCAPFSFSAVKPKALRKLTFVLDELRLILQKSAAVRK